MRVIIVSGAIYPSLYPRAFRATELATAMSNMGHQVVLYGTLGNYDYTNFKKETGVIVKNIGKSKWGNVNSDLPVPTGAHRFTIRKVVNYAFTRLFHSIIDYPFSEYFFLVKRVLKKEPPADLLITVAVPYGIHWAAANHIRHFGHNKFKRWIADCGDPMMGNLMNKYNPFFLAPIERYWCKYADKIVVPFEKAKEGYYPEFRDKMEAIPQSIDFSKVRIESYRKNDIPTFFYCGTVYEGIRDPSLLLEYLCTIDRPFRFIVYSKSRLFDVFQDRLGGKLEIKQPIPRLDLIRVMSTMDFLINISNDSDVQLPSKLIDYGLSQRPILNISSRFSDNEIELFNRMLNGDYSRTVVIDNLSQYDSRIVARRFLSI